MLFNIASIVAVALAATSIVDAEPCKCHFENILVFGDSYSDVGNVYKLSNHAWPIKDYDHGRFSNGPVWSEHVARHKSLRLKNYAHGGATTDSTFVQGYSGAASDLPVPGFIQQIDQYYAKSPLPKRDLASSIFVVDFQGNDYFFGPAATTTPTAVVDNILKGIEKLVKLGARNILVVENFDFGTIPYFGANPAAAESFTKLAVAQQAVYKDLEYRLAKKYGRASDAKHPFRSACHGASNKVTFGYYRLNDLFNHIRQPNVLKRLGITDVAHGCVSNDYKTVCKDAGNYFFWDAFHPTAKVHKVIGDAITEMI